MGNLRSIIQTIDQIETWLVSLRENGIETLPLDAPLTLEKTPTPTRARALGVSAKLAQIAANIAGCARCPLHSIRNCAVPGQGSFKPDILFVGEAPGKEEDRSGQAFVGPAGELLTAILSAMGLARDDVFITNAIKCRPPQNRLPLPGEVRACIPHLHDQIEALAPRIIVALGPTAAAALAGQNTAAAFTPGAWGALGLIDVLVTYHPAYLLTHPEAKAHVWRDMKAVLAKLGRQPPKKQR